MSFLASLFPSHTGCSLCASDVHHLDLFQLRAETWLTCTNTGWDLVSQWIPPMWDRNKRPESHEFEGLPGPSSASRLICQTIEWEVLSQAHTYLSLWQHKVWISPSIHIPHFSGISSYVPPKPYETGRTNINLIFLKYRLENLSPWEGDFPNFL